MRSRVVRSREDYVVVGIWVNLASDLSHDERAKYADDRKNRYLQAEASQIGGGWIGARVHPSAICIDFPHSFSIHGVDVDVWRDSRCFAHSIITVARTVSSLINQPARSPARRSPQINNESDLYCALQARDKQTTRCTPECAKHSHRLVKQTCFTPISCLSHGRAERAGAWRAYSRKLRWR